MRIDSVLEKTGTEPPSTGRSILSESVEDVVNLAKKAIRLDLSSDSEEREVVPFIQVFNEVEQHALIKKSGRLSDGYINEHT